jgi:hypothetical protein
MKSVIILALVLVAVQASRKIDDLKAKIETHKASFGTLDDDGPHGHDVPEGYVAPSYATQYTGREWAEWPQANDDQRESHQRCPDPLPTASPVAADFEFLGGRSWSGSGPFVWPTTNTAPVMGLQLHYDYPTRTLVVNHTTTFHWMTGGCGTGIPLESYICLMVGTTWDCRNQTTFGGVCEWEAAYRAVLKVINKDYPSENGAVLRSHGRSFDHHLARTLRGSIQLETIKRGPFAGLPSRHQFALRFVCSEQLFDWVFDCYVLGRPPASKLSKGPVLTAQIAAAPGGQLQPYRLFIGNFNCAPTTPPPV